MTNPGTEGMDNTEDLLQDPPVQPRLTHSAERGKQDSCPAAGPRHFKKTPEEIEAIAKKYPGTRNLIPIKKGQHDIPSLGGVAKSPQKSYSQKLYQIRQRAKEGRLRTSDADWLLERVTDKSMMSADILSYLDEVRQTVHPSQRVALANTYNQVCKTIHGEKVQTENININVDMNDLIKQAYEERRKKEEPK